MLLLFLLFFTCLCAKTEKGAWEVTYLEGSDCGRKDLQVATFMSDQCIVVDRSSDENYGLEYICSNDPNHHNVSYHIFRPGSCARSVTYGDFVETDYCQATETEYGNLKVDWFCKSEYNVTYSNLAFNLPMYVNESDNIGTQQNPFIAMTFQPLLKCFYQKQMDYHITMTCDSETGEGLIKMFKTRLCLIAAHKIKMTKGEIVDLSQISGEKIFMKYEGCINL